MENKPTHITDKYKKMGDIVYSTVGENLGTVNEEKVPESTQVPNPEPVYQEINIPKEEPIVKEPLVKEEIKEEVISYQQEDKKEDAFHNQFYQYQDPYSKMSSASKEDVIKSLTNGDRCVLTNLTFEEFQARMNQLDNPNSDVAVAMKSLPMHVQAWIESMLRTGNLYKAYQEGNEVVKNLVENNSYFNSYNYANKELGISHVPYKKDGTQRSLFNQFKAALGGGRSVNIPLYHSGFRIILAPPTINELTSLQLEIVKESVEIGRMNYSLTASSERGANVESFKNFIESKLQGSTLDLDLETEDIFNYISILDLEPMLLGLLSGTYVNKLPVSLACNSVGSDVPCSSIYHADLDPSKLLIIDRDILDSSFITTIGKRELRSVSLPEQANYVERLNLKINKVRNRNPKYKKQDAIFVFGIPSINSYLEDSQYWIEQTTSSVNTIVSSNTDASRERVIDSIMTASVLSSYTPSVIKLGYISPDNGKEEYGDDRTYIRECLTDLSNDITIYKELPKEVSNYVSNSYVSIVALPSFICPTCGSKNESDGSKGVAFDKFIPLDTFNFFLTLVGWQLIMRQDIHQEL